MQECKDQRGCDFSSFSQKDKICALYKACDILDISEVSYTTSKWSCELPSTCKYQFKNNQDLWFDKIEN